MLPSSSTSTMQPKAHAMAGSTRRRAVAGRAGTAPCTSNSRRSLSIQLEAIADAQQAQGAQAHRGCQHDPLEQWLPQRLDVEHEQQVADGPEHQRAEDGADRAARPAEE